MGDGYRRAGIIGTTTAALFTALYLTCHPANEHSHHPAQQHRSAPAARSRYEPRAERPLLKPIEEQPSVPHIARPEEPPKRESPLEAYRKANNLSEEKWALPPAVFEEIMAERTRLDDVGRVQLDARARHLGYAAMNLNLDSEKVGRLHRIWKDIDGRPNLTEAQRIDAYFTSLKLPELGLSEQQLRDAEVYREHMLPVNLTKEHFEQNRKAFEERHKPR